MLAISEYSYNSTKISWRDISELNQKISKITMSKLISITSCAPDRTDTNNWSRVYYEYRIR